MSMLVTLPNAAQSPLTAERRLAASPQRSSAFNQALGARKARSPSAGRA
jgi:hypothetical protein